jgi:post-segregation antitoxin (ccd killing protein)
MRRWAGVRQALDHAKAPRVDIVERGRRQAADPVGAEARAKIWAEENAEAIAEPNERIARRGLIGDEWRKW